MGFTKKQVSEITNLPLRLVQYYTERNLVTPEVDLGEGKGRTRKYSRKNLVEFGIIKSLTEYGMAFGNVKAVMNLLKTPLLQKEGNNLKIDWSGIIGQWQEIDKNSYIVLYKRPNKPDLPLIATGGDPSTILDQQWVDQTESILIIKLNNIITRAKKHNFFSIWDHNMIQD